MNVFLKTNRAAPGAQNPCSYTDTAIYSIDKSVKGTKTKMIY